MMDNLRESLQAAFPDTMPQPPLEVLVQYIVGAQLTLIDWWITSRTPYDADQIAGMLHRMQTAVIRDAYGLET